jgi:VRR-NUC domain
MARKAQIEHGLSHWVDWWLERAVVRPCWFTAQETGVNRWDMTPAQYMRVMQLRQARGIKPHALDWMLFQKPEFLCFELKVGNNPVSDQQEATMRLLAAQGIPVGVCRSVHEVFGFLRRCGIRLNDSAPYVANLAHEHYLAARRQAAGAKPKRATKPRAAKPTRSRVTAVESVRGRVPF